MKPVEELIIIYMLFALTSFLLFVLIPEILEWRSRKKKAV